MKKIDESEQGHGCLDKFSGEVNHALISNSVYPVYPNVVSKEFEDLQDRVQLLENLVGDLCRHIDDLERKMEVKVRNYWQDRRMMNESHAHSPIG